VLTADLSTRELTTCRLKLSDELIFVPQEHAGSTFYHIEAPSKGRFYRVGYPEYVFLSLLDGRTTMAQAVTLSVRALGAEALSQPKALEVALWLLEQGLAQVVDDPQSAFRTTEGPTKQSGLQRLNPFWIKLPLLRPDRMLQAILPLTSWLFSPFMTVLGLLVISLGLVVIATCWGEFVASSQLIFSPHNWLLMALVWGVLKLVHETAHGLVCKRYGGEVREAGIILILLAPAAFVDVTSCWRFPSKWQRIHVAVAGMFCELVLAALAAIVWTQVDSTILRHLLFNTIVMASFSTLVFNANPLMRFDGYYILADFLEIPNLASEGMRFVRRLGARLFFGQVPVSRDLLGSRGWIVRVYGIAAWLWRLFVCASLLAAASVLFKGAGLALGAFGAASWFGKPLVHTARELLRQSREVPLRVLRAAVVTATLAGALYVVLVLLPWPAPVTAPVVVEYTDQSIVRSRCDGFVAKIHVHNGMHVQPGDILLDLKNDELETEFLELQSSISQADVTHRTALHEHEASQAQVALRNRQAMVERLAEIEERRAGLRVYAPVAGRVVARDLHNALGTYVEEGAELLTVADEGHKELLVSIGHAQINDIAPLVGQVVSFRMGDFQLYEGTLTQLEPRASRQLPHPALSATVGGDLPVVQSDAESDQTGARLVDPQFPGVIALPPETSQQLACGNRGYAILGLSQERIGQHLWTRFSRWLHQLNKLRKQ
jgi:putative peptide zinc metalloprotease protein